MDYRTVKCALAGLIASVLACAPACAQPAADFYKGRQIALIVGSNAGSGYDVYARLLARHMGKHIPGAPYFVVQNMPGAGALTMTNTVVNKLPKDGATIGAPQSSVIVEKLLHLLSENGKAANFEATKLNWLGTMSQDVFVFLGWHETPVRNMEDLTKKTYAMGVSGPNTDGYLIGSLTNRLLGTKINIVTGYAGAAAELLSLERREIDVAPMAYSSALTLRPDLLSAKKFPVLLQMGAAPHPDLKATPTFESLVKTDEDRATLALIFAKYQMGRPFFVAPQTPRDRLAVLRKAFDAALADKDLRAEAQKMKLEIDPLGGEAVQKLVEKLYAQPEALVRRARDFLGKKS